MYGNADPMGSGSCAAPQKHGNWSTCPLGDPGWRWAFNPFSQECCVALIPLSRPARAVPSLPLSQLAAFPPLTQNLSSLLPSHGLVLQQRVSTGCMPPTTPVLHGHLGLTCTRSGAEGRTVLGTGVRAGLVTLRMPKTPIADCPNHHHHLLLPAGPYPEHLFPQFWVSSTEQSVPASQPQKGDPTTITKPLQLEVLYLCSLGGRSKMRPWGLVGNTW